MKYLIFTDTHIHSWKNFGVDSVTGLSKRLIEQQKVLIQIHNLVEQEKVDGVIFIGDLFHSVGSVSIECLNTIAMFFKALKVPYYLVPGNHDLINRKNPNQFQYSGKIFNNLKCPKNIKLIGFHEEIDYSKVKGYDIVAIHQTPINAKIGNYEFPEGFNWKELAQNNKFVFVGHIHQRQELAPNCIVVGSPMHLTFGDSGDRGIYIFDTDKVKATFHKLNYPEFINVVNIEDAKEDGNYYKVLNSSTKISNNPNIKVSVTPTFFEERIKSSTFLEILKEWLIINEKPKTYLENIKDIVDEKYQLGKKIFKGKLTSVEIKDFGSIKDITYDVTNGFTLVTGNNDVFDSNGSGKSTLFEAIYWCLFGETTKGLTGNDVIRNRPIQQEDCEVALFLNSPVESYCISRSRKNGVGITYSTKDNPEWKVLTGRLKQVERQEILENIIGFNQTLFLSSCYFSQENLLMLTGLSDTERTNLITDLLGFENYDNLYEVIFGKIKQLDYDKTISLEEVERFNFVIEKDKSNISIFKKQEEENLNSILKAQRLIGEYKAIIANIFFDISNPKKDLVIEKTVDYDSLIENNKIKIKLIDTFLGELEIKKEEVNTKNYNIKNLIESRRIEIEHLLKEQKDLIKQYEDLKILTGKCDKCGALITQESVEIFKKEKQIKIDKLGSSIENLKIQIKNLDKDYSVSLNSLKNTQEKIYNYKKEEDLLIEKTAEANDNKFEQLEKQKKLEKYRNGLISDQKEYNKLIEVYEKEIEGYINKNLKVNKEIKEIENSIENSKHSIGVLSNQITKIDNNKLILEFWKIAFSSTGIKTLLLDKFCNDFNSCVNEYLSEVSLGNMSITMSPISILKSGEERNKLEMLIKLDQIEVKYKSLSGGEKRRIDSSLCFGLSKYVSTKYGLTESGLLGLMILDEVFSGLDKSGEEALATILKTESNNKSIFVIDHALNLISYADRSWVVKKENNISFLKGGYGQS